MKAVPTRHGLVHIVRRCAPCGGPVVLFASWDDDTLLGWCTGCENATPLDRPESRTSLDRIAPDGVYLPAEDAIPASLAPASGPVPEADSVDLGGLDVLAELSILRGALDTQTPAGWRGLVTVGLVVMLFVGTYQVLSALSYPQDGGWGAGSAVAMAVGAVLVGVGLATRRRGADAAHLPAARLKK